VEVVRFGWRDTRTRLLELVDSAELRRGDDNEPYVTDENHYILDCAPRATGEMAELAAAVKAMAGVVEHGLFLTEADLALLGRPDGEIEELRR
jgi:ribose 5-phosphate isomerase A